MVLNRHPVFSGNLIGVLENLISIRLERGRKMSTLFSSGFWSGNVSTGLMHATPGEMKSLRSSADKMALIFTSPVESLRVSREMAKSLKARLHR